MALSSDTVWEVRPTIGSDTNGGAFVTGSGGTDYSQQNSKNTVGNNISTTDAVANGTTTITSATAAFTAAIVGNIIYFQGGTGSITAQWRQVTAFTNATTITIDASIAASTGMTMNIGGALGSLGMVGASILTGHTVHIGNTGTNLVTTATTNVSGGCFDGGSLSINIFGYNTTRLDAPTGNNRPLIQASGITGFTLLVNSGTNSQISWLRLDGNSLTGGNGTQCLGNGTWLNEIDVANFTSNGFHNFLGIVFHARCSAHSCNTGFAGNSLTTVYIDSQSYSNTGVGFIDGVTASGCIAANNGSVGFSGIQERKNCTAYGNASHGFLGGYSRNCISVNNGNRGYQSPLGLWNCADFNNFARTGGTVGIMGDNNPIVLTGDPFTNAAGNDYSLNSTAGAGASCRAAGYPGVLEFGGTGNIDVGALQSASGGGATTHSAVF